MHYLLLTGLSGFARDGCIFPRPIWYYHDIAHNVGPATTPGVGWNENTAGILTQLTQKTPESYLWCGLLGQTYSILQQSSRSATFLILGFLTTYKHPRCSLGSRGDNSCLAYVHSQMNLHTCAKFGVDSPVVWQLSYIIILSISDPLNPQNAPIGYTGLVFI